MNKVYFISEDYLKKSTTINQNVEMSIINNSILDAQEEQIQTIIGSVLYNKICTLITGNTMSAVGNEKYNTLFTDFIKPAVAYYTWHSCLLFIRFKMMNKSIGGQSSDNSTPAELSEVIYLSDTIKNKAEFKGQRLMKYLLENRNNFAELNEATHLDTIKPLNNSYSCPTVFDDLLPYTDWDKLIYRNNR